MQYIFRTAPAYCQMRVRYATPLWNILFFCRFFVRIICRGEKKKEKQAGGNLSATKMQFQSLYISRVSVTASFYVVLYKRGGPGHPDLDRVPALVEVLCDKSCDSVSDWNAWAGLSGTASSLYCSVRLGETFLWFPFKGMIPNNIKKAFGKFFGRKTAPSTLLTFYSRAAF